MAKNGNGKQLASAVNDYQLAKQAMDVAQALTPSNQSLAKRAEGKSVKKTGSEGEGPSKLKTGLADLGASVAAQGLNEGWMYLMRLAGRAAGDGWLAEQNDLLQSLGPSSIGLIWYLIELYKLGPKAPSTFKMSRMEAAKLMGNLGMSKFFAALRERSSLNKKAIADAQGEARKAMAANEVQRKQLDELQKRLEEMQREQGAGGAKK
jgi:hypothetical protein